MNSQKNKKNSIKFPNKLNIVEYSLKNDQSKKIFENQINKKQNNSRNTNNININNNIYIKSKYNIKKESNELPNYLKNDILKEPNIFNTEKNKILNKHKNINVSTPDIRLEKSEDTPSTTTFTKDIIENKRPLSCEKRRINKDMIFVKKKIQGNLRNSFILNKSEEKEDERNNSCFCIRNNNSFTEKNKDKNNIDINNEEKKINNDNNYIKKNIVKYFDNNLDDNNKDIKNVLINNNNINLITNNNYINNSLAQNYLKDLKHNSDNKMTRLNNSVRLRRNKKILKEYFDKNLIEINNNNNSPTISNLKKFNFFFYYRII